MRFFALSVLFIQLISTAAIGADRAVDITHQLNRVMQEQVTSGFWGAVFVAQGDKILLKEGYGIADRKSDTLFDAQTIVSSGSLSKQVTATAVIELVEQGRLSLTDPISKFFNNVPADKQNITVQQLLSHSAGLASWVFPEDFVPIPRNVWLEKVFDAALIHPVGSGYHYSNDGITLAAMIVEKITGVPFKQYLQDTYFRPLGMKHTGWFDTPVFDSPSVTVATGYRNSKDDGAPNEWPGPYWALLGNGGILWSLDDMYTWHRAIHKTRLSDFAREHLFDRIVLDPESNLYPAESSPMYYGLGWRIGRSKCGGTRIGHTGTGLSHNVDYRYYRERDIVIYVASNRIDVDHKAHGTFYARKAAVALAAVFMKNC